MDKLGDFETEMIQDMAESITRIFGKRAEENGLVVESDKQKFSSTATVVDRGTVVFQATRYADGDQIVSRCVCGDWRRRLANAAGQPVVS